MKFSLFCRFDRPYSEVALRTMPVLMRYCARHGYRLTILQDPLVRRDIIWDRMRPMTGLEPHDSHDADWLVHVDADVLITNPEITLEAIVEKAGSASVIVGSGIYTGTMQMHVNDGILMVRQNEHGQRIAQAMWNASGDAVFCPLDGLRDLLASRKESERIFVAPPRLMNSYRMVKYNLPETTEGQWRIGDFVLHLPGISNQRRVTLLDILCK